MLQNCNLAFQEALRSNTSASAYQNSEAYQSSVISSIATKFTEHTSTSNDETEISAILINLHSSAIFVVSMSAFAQQKMQFVIFARKVDILREYVENRSCTRSQNEHDLERTQSSRIASSQMQTIPNEHLHLYS